MAVTRYCASEIYCFWGNLKVKCCQDRATIPIWLIAYERLASKRRIASHVVLWLIISINVFVFFFFILLWLVGFYFAIMRDTRILFGWIEVEKPMVDKWDVVLNILMSDYLKTAISYLGKFVANSIYLGAKLCDFYFFQSPFARWMHYKFDAI